MNCRWLVFSLASWLLLFGSHRFSFAQAPTPRDELLALVPGDAGFCLIVQNLRAQADEWRRSPWVKGLLATPFGKALVDGPELKRIAAVEKELQKQLQIDWAGLRDDIFGDAVVLAYWPAPPGQPEQEQGLLLVRPRNSKLLAQLIERLNEEQKKTGELKMLTVLEHQGVKYQRRTDVRSTHFVLVADNLFAFTRKEHLLQGVIDARKRDKAADKNVIVQQVTRAGAEKALGILWINPRAFDVELNQQAKKDGPEAQLARSFLTYWRPIDAMVLSVSDGGELELRVAVQAQTDKLPKSIRNAFEQQGKPAELWNRFPPGAVLSVAGRIDVGQLAESVGEFLTPQNRKAVVDALQDSLGAAIGLNIAKDVLPQIGPDWGFCVVAASDAKFPHVLAALAVNPGSKDVPVDRALANGVRTFVTLAAFAHNRINSGKPVHLKSVSQNNVEVNYLAGDKFFPAGLRPAWALKDGYLVFASSPDALLHFRVQPPVKPFTGSETPIIRLSATELNKLVRAKRQLVVEHLADKNQISKLDADQKLESALGVLDLFDTITIARGAGQGQMVLTMRIRPRNP